MANNNHNINTQPMNIREKKQIRNTKLIMFIITLFIGISSTLSIIFQEYSHVNNWQWMGIIVSYIVLILSYSSVFLHEWTIGMIPPAVFSLFLFLVSKYYNKLITSSKTVLSLIVLVTVIILSLLAFVFVIVSIIMFFASLNSVSKKRDNKNLTLIVLGCRLNENKPSKILVKRLETAYAYLKNYEEIKCILSGGKIDGEERAEADVMYEYLIERGIPSTQMIIENTSTTTYENIKFCKRIAECHNLSMRFAVVTDRFHQYRVRLICKDNGISNKAINVATPFCLLLQYWSREVLCLFEKWIKKL